MGILSDIELVQSVLKGIRDEIAADGKCDWDGDIIPRAIAAADRLGEFVLEVVGNDWHSFG